MHSARSLKVAPIPCPAEKIVAVRSQILIKLTRSSQRDLLKPHGARGLGMAKRQRSKSRKRPKSWHRGQVEEKAWGAIDLPSTGLHVSFDGEPFPLPHGGGGGHGPRTRSGRPSVCS